MAIPIWHRFEPHALGATEMNEMKSESSDSHAVRIPSTLAPRSAPAPGRCDKGAAHRAPPPVGRNCLRSACKMKKVLATLDQGTCSDEARGKRMARFPGCV